MLPQRQRLLSLLLILSAGSYLSAQQPALQLPSLGSRSAPVTSTQEEPPLAREMLALELAKTAAENGSQDLSLEAFKRVMDSYHRIFPAAPSQIRPASNIQSSLLSTPESADPFANPFGIPNNGQFTAAQMQMLAQMANGQTNQVLFADSHALLVPLFELVQSWKTQKFDASKVTDVLKQAVLPEHNPKVVQMLAVTKTQSGQVVVPRTITRTVFGPNGQRTTSTTTVNVLSSTQRGFSTPGQPVAREQIGTIQRFRNPELTQSLGLYLIDWAAAADRLEPIISDLKSRSSYPEAQDAHALLVYALRSQGKPELAAEYIAKLLVDKSIEPHRWTLIVQAAMQPLAKDQVNGVRSGDLNVASATLPTETMDKLLRYGLQTDVVGVAPYYQQLIRRAIQADDVKWLSSIVPDFITQLQTIGGTNDSTIRSGVWNEVLTECIRIGHPHMALKALPFLHDPLKPSAATATTVTALQDETRVKGLLSLCALPIEKRLTVTRAMVLEDAITTTDVFHFCNMPECAAPIYLRLPEWQAANALLQADPKSGTLSLLDLLLADAEASGQLNETLDQLFTRMPEGDVNKPKISRMVCEWVSMRAEARGTTLPERVVTERAKLVDTDFESWLLTMPAPIQKTLVAHFNKKPDSAAAKLLSKFNMAADGSLQPAKKVSESADDKSQWLSTDSLRHWLRIAVPEPANSQAFAGYEKPFRAWQVSDDKRLRSPNTSASLILKYPLEGNYTLRYKVNGTDGNWIDSIFGGVINGTFLEYRARSQSGARVTLPSLNGRLTSSLNSSFRMNDNPDATPTVEVECICEDNRVAISINGKKLAHAEFASHSFPFAGLVPMSTAEHSSVEITGSPKIAREVNLLDKSFSGWSARRYDRLLTNVIQLRPADSPPIVEPPSTSQLASWKIEDNELRSDDPLARAVTSDTKTLLRITHNSMLYVRPLLDGERFEYEAWTDKDTRAALPVIGLTAMLIEDGKIRLHWLPTVREVQSSGVTANNRGDDPQAEQLSEAKLLESGWNKFSLRIEGSRMILNINGTDIYRRPIPENSTTEFGWLSTPDQPSVRIRNATLKGNWPEKLPDDLWEASK